MHNTILIIGSGISALAAAEILCKEKNVIIFTKSLKEISNSALAQGGIAAAMDTNDDWQAHLSDTLNAACAHADPEHAALLAEYGPDYIKKWMDKGFAFDRNADGSLAMAQEGAHGRRRILHSGGDATGSKFIQFMLATLQKHANVRFVEQEIALDITLANNGVCTGIITKNKEGQLKTYHAEAVILATGGIGSLFSCTSNQPVATGDGIAMAYRAGATITDMEFIQFHPTILHQNGKCLGLVSEAVRGEGGVLQDVHGRRIMEGIHPLLDLAPRDVVARQIYKESKEKHDIFLNVTHVDRFPERFPTIHALCQSHGIHPDKDLIPITPGAHFLMGGIEASVTGETTVPGLFAIGETACTGVHGANRLASNSLLEGLVFGSMTAEQILHRKWTTEPLYNNTRPVVERVISGQPLPTKLEIQQMMMEKAGLLRTAAELLELILWLEQFDFHQRERTSLSWEAVEIVNMLTVSWLIATAAYQRTESRGGHYRTDYPQTDKAWQGKRINRQVADTLQPSSYCIKPSHLLEVSQ